MKGDPGTPEEFVAAGNASGATVAVLIAACMTVGCANPFSPEGDDVGVYKGDPDPLMETSPEERRDALRERFEIIQSR